MAKYYCNIAMTESLTHHFKKAMVKRKSWIAAMVASMYTSVEGTLANMGNMQKQYWSIIAPILSAIGEWDSRIDTERTLFWYKGLHTALSYS